MRKYYSTYVVCDFFFLFGVLLLDILLFFSRPVVINMPNMVENVELVLIIIIYIYMCHMTIFNLLVVVCRSWNQNSDAGLCIRKS